jgi:hypothetical protein
MGEYNDSKTLINKSFWGRCLRYPSGKRDSETDSKQ